MGFRERLRSREPLIGTWVKSPSPVVCEVLADTDLDLICIDAEHAPFDRLTQDLCLQHLRSADMPAFVRIPAAREEYILNALDCGATGVVIPHVTSAAMAEAMVKASHFGPGGRGYAGSTRAAGYTTRAMGDHLEGSASATTVIAQIEDLEALDVIDEIAQVDGVDCLFIGRIDLTVAMKAESPKAAEVVEAVERVCAAGREAGVAVGMFVGDMAEVPHWKEAGATLFILGSDHGFLRQGATSLVSAFRT